MVVVVLPLQSQVENCVFVVESPGKALTVENYIKEILTFLSYDVFFLYFSSHYESENDDEDGVLAGGRSCRRR